MECKHIYSHIAKGDLHSLQNSHPGLITILEKDTKALAIAVENGRLNIVKYLMEEWCSIEEVKSMLNYIIMICCKKDYSSILKYLVDNCYITEKELYQESAVSIALKSNSMEILKYLISLEYLKQDSVDILQNYDINWVTKCIKYLCEKTNSNIVLVYYIGIESNTCEGYVINEKYRDFLHDREKIIVLGKRVKNFTPSKDERIVHVEVIYLN